MRHNKKIIYLAGFLFSLPFALTAYLNSSFLSSFVEEKYVGIIYAVASITSVLALLLAPKIFRKIGGYKFLLLATLLNILSLFSLTLVTNAWSAIINFIIYFSLNILIFFSLDELLKIFSKDTNVGRTRGIYLALCSLSWVLAQFASGAILEGFSFREIYLTSALLTVLFLLLSYTSLSNISDPKYDKTKALKYVLEFFKNKNLARAYSMSLLLQFFFAWMVIYTPIYLSVHLGFAWNQIGIIFAIMLLPFFIIPFHLGKYADKIGERKMLIFGFLLTACATLSLFYISTHKIWVWALALFITRIGAATIEVMSDAYFFKHIKPENEQYIGVYRSASPVAFVIGPLFAFLVFLFVPSFNFIYTILGALMLSGVYLASTIRKSDI